MDFKFTAQAWSEYLTWQSEDKKIQKRVNELLKDIARAGNVGLGKPEALKGDLSGFWYRRITEEHRLIYRIKDGVCEIVQCKGHY